MSDSGRRGGGREMGNLNIGGKIQWKAGENMLINVCGDEA